MTEGLPLIPARGGACGDVRSVLRCVFRAGGALPPSGPSAAGRLLDDCERRLRREHAGRVARDEPSNKYRRRAAPAAPAAGDALGACAALRRGDLAPAVEQNASRNAAMWLENVLAASSGASEVEVRGERVPLPPPSPPPPRASCPSSRTLSLGEHEPRGRPPPAPLPVPPPPPEYVVCVPPALEFVDFVLHREHTRTLRLVNVSAVEVRLAVLPPARRELDVELCGRLTVTSGAATELRVRFLPGDVRVLRDRLVVRVSLGRHIEVPIACYMRPPLLDVLVPSASEQVAEAARPGDQLDLGARLLGDVHWARVVLRCAASHAAFFLLPEEAWLSGALTEMSTEGVVRSGAFSVWPAAWRGGGEAVGWARCRPRAPGLHAAALRLLASTAVARPLTLLADALLHRADHVTLQAHDRDYDAASPDDPACDHYVHLGTAHPHREVAAVVHVVNRSAVAYSFYWITRPWGVCACDRMPEGAGELGAEDDGEHSCPGRRRAAPLLHDAATSAVSVQPADGSVAPRSSCAVRVSVADVGSTLGTQRTVLMLVLRDVPRESFPPGFEPDVVRTVTTRVDPVPGEEAEEREACDVGAAQLEVWWEVAPLRFVLDPPALLLRHSRRVPALRLNVRATQLFGGEGAQAAWRVTAATPEGPRELPAPKPPHLSAARSAAATLLLPLAAPPDERPLTDVITLTAADAEWTARCSVRRVCPRRHPGVSPPRSWLGVAPPGANVRTELRVRNDTHQPAWWAAAAWRWWGERPPSGACIGALRPCPECRERTCSCGLLHPLRAELPPGRDHAIQYEVNAPERDGCVATLVRVRRAEADCAAEAACGGGAAVEARASLVAYRVLAPRLVLRVLPCAGAGLARPECACPGPRAADAGHTDEGQPGATGGEAALLRPLRALVLGTRSCWRLRVRNLTPLPTTVRWQPPPDGEDVLKVTFIPNDFDVGSYAEMEIQVVVQGAAVSPRRAFVRRAQVARARRPLHLLLDVAVAGLEVEFQLPIGGAEHTDAFVLVRRSQRPAGAGNGACGAEASAEEAFAVEDMKRAVRAENRCRCRSTLQYIPPPPRRPQPPADPASFPPVEIVWSPPPLTRVCRCWRTSAPQLPAEAERCCLQFWRLPLRTVRSRVVVVRNVSPLTARWSACVRRFPLQRVRTLVRDAWSAGVGPSGLALSPRPASGVLAAGGVAQLELRAYADSWGVFHDQLLVQISQLEPLVVDVWVEAVGAPLEFALRPSAPSAPPGPSPALHAACAAAADTPVLWVSPGEACRSLRAKNTARGALLVQAFALRGHGHAADTLPLRLYVRLFDVPARTCPCLTAFVSDSALYGSSSSSAGDLPEEMDVGVELFLGPDYGTQEGALLTVEPALQSLAPGAAGEWRVALPDGEEGGPASPHSVLLRALPEEPAGSEWARPEPPPQVVLVQPAPREARLLVPRRELLVELCALHLPADDVLRVRKRFRVQNVGDGHLHATVTAGEPWSVVRGESGPACGAGCMRLQRGRRVRTAPLCLPPRSAAEVAVEIAVRAADVWPAPVAKLDPEALESPADASRPAAGAGDPPAYPERRELVDALTFADAVTVLQTVRLVLRLELPRLMVEPPLLNLGFVTDGDCRKDFITVWHTSRAVTLRLAARWVGAAGVRLRPLVLAVPPGARARLYVLSRAGAEARPLLGHVEVRAAGAAGAWCRARIPLRLESSRDARWHASPHDYTDEPRLLPSDLLL